MIYTCEPEDFNPVVEVVSCFIEFEGKMLMLLRQDHKHEGNKWGAIGGKVEGNEGLHEALHREVGEELGILLNNPQHHHKLYVRFPDQDFIYHVFHDVLNERPEIVLNVEENKDFLWVTPVEALMLNLVRDEAEVIKLFYRLP